MYLSNIARRYTEYNTSTIILEEAFHLEFPIFVKWETIFCLIAWFFVKFLGKAAVMKIKKKEYT